MTILVVTEARFVRGPDGRIASTNGVDAYPFWGRYRDVFDRVLVAARVADVGDTGRLAAVEGPGVAVRPLPAYLGPWGFLRRRHDVSRALAAGLADADVLCLRAPGPIAGLAWRLRGARPFAVEVVGDPEDSLGPGAVRSLARRPARAALARDLRGMCREAVAAAYVTQGALQRRYPATGWATSYSSIELPEEAFASDAELDARAACARRRDADAPWRLVSVGTLAQRYKGHDVLVDALAVCRARGLAAELTIVGDGRYRAELEARAGAGVRFTGQLPPGAAVRAVVDAADLFVLASRAEGLPRALIEAMARGVPGVATAVGGIPELLPENRLVAPGNAHALAHALLRLCSPATDVGALARRDRQVARAYRADVLRARRQALYRRLARAAAAPVRLPEAG